MMVTQSEIDELKTKVGNFAVNLILFLLIAEIEGAAENENLPTDTKA